MIDKGHYYPRGIQRWDHLQEPLPKSAIRNLLEKIVADYQALGCSRFYEDTSFPFGGVEPQFSKYVSGGNHRGSGRYPRIADLLGLMAELVEFRILAIYRSPLSTVRSTLRRGFSNDLKFECQLAESIHLDLAEITEAGKIYPSRWTALPVTLS